MLTDSQYDDDFFALLRVTHKAIHRVSAFYDSNLTLPVVPVTSEGSLNFTGDGELQCTGDMALAKGNESLEPQSKADTLAPFGQEVLIERVDIVGSREVVTPMGQLRITGIPSMKAYKIMHRQQFIDQGWFAKLDLKDRFDKVRADTFLYPEAPNFENSTWEEIQRLANIPIVRTDLLPDRALPSGITYDATSRLDTLRLLFSNLGGVPHLTRFGQLTGRLKDVWLTATAPVFTIYGTIDMDDSLSNDVYNSVRVKSSSGDNSLVAVREITDPGDPLRVSGPLGRRVYTQESSLYDSQAAVDDAADTILARVSTRMSKVVNVTCLPQPHLELGDYIRAIDTATGREVDGEISTIGYSMNALGSMTIGLIAAETR